MTDLTHDGRPPFRLDHYGIVVPDIDAAEAWYAEMFGAARAWKEDPTDVDAVAIGLPGEAVRLCGRVLYVGGAYLELHQFFTPTSADPERLVSHLGYGHVAFFTPNIYTAYEWLSGKGMHFYAEPREITEGGLAGHTWVYGEDPWGNVLQLCSHPAPPAAALAGYGDEVDASGKAVQTLSSGGTRANGSPTEV